MSFLEKLTLEELDYILNCNKLKEINRKFDEHITMDWIHNLRQKHKLKIKNNRVSQSLFESLNDAPSYPIVAIWSLIGLVNLGLITLIVITVGCAALTLTSGGIFFYSTYKEKQKEMKKNNQFIDLAVLKLACAKEIINRRQNEIETLLHKSNIKLEPFKKSITPVIKQSINRNPHRLTMMKNSLSVGMLTSAMLFGTYYLGISSVVAAFGASAAVSMMLGPIGLGVAIGIAAGIGIYFGYKYYQTCKRTAKINKIQKYLISEIELKTQECDKMQNELQQLQQLQQLPSANHVATLTCKETKSWKRPRSNSYSYFTSPMSLTYKPNGGFLNNRKEAYQERNFDRPQFVI